MKTKILGPIMELITLIGALVYANYEGWPAISAGIVSVGIIAYRIYNHKGPEKIFSAIRKFLSLVPAIGVQLGIFDISQGESIIAFIAPLISVVWSWKVNKGNGSYSSGGFPVVLLLGCCLSLFAVSCKSIAIDLTGQPRVGDIRTVGGVIVRSNSAGDSKAVIDGTTIGTTIETVWMLIKRK
jgi:hypothetical protein